MKLIGMLGGMSWESTAEYYRIMNETVKAKLGGMHSVKCMLYSFDFAEIEQLQIEKKWGEAAHILVQAAKKLEQAGACCIIICTNTMHKLAEEVQDAVAVPLIHIADSTAEEIISRGINTVGLLGTRYTMEQEFYKNRLIDRFGINVLIPPLDDRKIVHNIIYDELCMGTVNEDSRKEFQRIIINLVESGAEGIILGCTEIPLLVKQEDSSIPLFDTTFIHANAAVEFMLKQDENASGAFMTI